MNLRVFNNEAQVGRAAATLVAAQILGKPDSVIGLTAGNTTLDTCHQLLQLTRDGIIDWQRVKVFSQDEYLGLPSSHELSRFRFLRDKLFSQINLADDALYAPDGMTQDPDAECLNYEKAIQTAGGLDFQLLTLGTRGQIGSIESGADFSLRTCCSTLSEDVQDTLARGSAPADTIPDAALTLGIGTIMRVPRIILLATDPSRAMAVASLVHGRIDPAFPASILQIHPHVTVLLDRSAASVLSR